MSAATEESSIADIFNKHYSEFCVELAGACPEYTEAIQKAVLLDEATRIRRYREEVVPSASPARNGSTCPGVMLPGVTMHESLWTSLSDGTQEAIQRYKSLLTFCCLYDGAKDLLHGEEGKAKLDGFDFSSFASTFMGDMKEKLEGLGGLGGMNLGGLSEKIAKMIESQAENLKKLPERLLKGNLGKLIMEIIAEVKPEDFGINPADIQECETNPASAFDLVSKLYTQNPQILQKTMMRIVKKLQAKFMTGELRIETMASEAEEFIKEFADNPAMVELMETFRNTFGMMDMDTAKAAGREGDARRNIVRERLRAKLEKRKAGGGK
jgi:hypothetical protein